MTKTIPMPLAINMHKPLLEPFWKPTADILVGKFCQTDSLNFNKHTLLNDRKYHFSALFHVNKITNTRKYHFSAIRLCK